MDVDRLDLLLKSIMGKLNSMLSEKCLKNNCFRSEECDRCKNILEMQSISSKEIEQLEGVMRRKLFESHPLDEVGKFMELVAKNAPFDVIVDGPNLLCGKTIKKTDTVSHLLQIDLNMCKKLNSFLISGCSGAEEFNRTGEKSTSRWFRVHERMAIGSNELHTRKNFFFHRAKKVRSSKMFSTKFINGSLMFIITQLKR